MLSDFKTANESEADVLRKKTQGEDLSHLWRIASDIRDKNLRVHTELTRNQPDQQLIESFLRELVAHAMAVRLASEQGNGARHLPIEAVTFGNFVRNLFTECCVENGYTDHHDVAAIWMSIEDSIDGKLNR